MVDGVDSQPLKTQRIQNSDADTPTRTFYTLKKKKQESQKCDQEPIFKTYLFCLLFSTQAKKMLFANSRRPHKRDP